MDCPTPSPKPSAEASPGAGTRTASASARTRIKICGLTREADVDAAVAAGADAIGFVRYEKSPRHVSAQRARQLATRLPPFVTPVLLFVNADPATVRAEHAALPDALVQFHGDETPAACAAGAAPGGRWMRAARVGPGFALLDFCRLWQAAGASAVLLDAFVEGYGGSGKVFDWSLVADVADAVVPPPDRASRADAGRVGLPLVLSGGLNAANVAEGIARLRPWAVDVSSGVEAAKGVKDEAAMRAFCSAVRAADAALRPEAGRPAASNV